jgi:hypothetical protein
VSLDDGRITLFIQPGSDAARRTGVIHARHKSILQSVLPTLIQKWEQLKLRLTAYHLRRMKKTLWGTCNHCTGHIRLNTELVTKPAWLLGTCWCTRWCTALVFRQGMGMAIAGVAVGLFIAAAASRYLGSLLVGVSAHDGVTFVLASLLLFIVAMLATSLPALAANRVQPVDALRLE